MEWEISAEEPVTFFQPLENVMEERVTFFQPMEDGTEALSGRTGFVFFQPLVNVMEDLRGRTNYIFSKIVLFYRWRCYTVYSHRAKLK